MSWSHKSGLHDRAVSRIVLALGLLLVDTAMAVAGVVNPAQTAISSALPATVTQEVFGRVLDSNGGPVAGAQVALAADQLGPVVLRGGILGGEDMEGVPQSLLVGADAEGRFRFDGEHGHPLYGFAAHAMGFAAATGRDLQENREIRLAPWGRVEGRLTDGCRGTDGRVWMVGLPGPASAAWRCGFRYDVPCDAEGRFVFEKVPAGWFNVGYLTPLGDGLEGLTSRTAVVVKAGRTAKVKIGCEGRPVVGRFVLPPDFGRSIRFGTGLCILRRCENIERQKAVQLSEEQLESDQYAVDAAYACDPRTDDSVTSIEEGRRQWYVPWIGADDSAHLMGDAIWGDTDWRGYAFRANPDGSFRVEDVVPGRYELSVSLAERRAGEDFLSPFAQRHATIQVPSTTQSHSDDAFDIGFLTLDVFGVGAPAPLFEARTYDDDPVRLIDYRGRFVLLSFSQTENGAIMDRLRELGGTYSARDDFQIIDIGYAQSEEGLNSRVVKSRLLFLHTDEKSFHRLVEQYRLFGCPDMVLIDPDGRIAATHLWDPDGGERVRRTVRDALDSVPTHR